MSNSLTSVESFTANSDNQTAGMTAEVTAGDCLTGSCMPRHSHEANAEIARIVAMIDDIHLYSLLPALVLGFIGNSLSFCVLVKSVKTSSMSNYLCALCVADNIFLTMSSISWFFWVATRTDLRSYIDCNVYYLVTVIPKLTSAWLLVAVAVERVLVVYRPTHAKAFCDVTRARLVICFITCIVTAFNWLYFGGYITVSPDTLDQGQHVCKGRTEALQWYIDTVSVWLQTTFYSIIPSIALVLLNGTLLFRFLQGGCCKRKQVAPLTMEMKPDESNTSSANTSEDTTKRTLNKYSRGVFTPSNPPEVIASNEGITCRCPHQNGRYSAQDGVNFNPSQE